MRKKSSSHLAVFIFASILVAGTVIATIIVLFSLFSKKSDLSSDSSGDVSVSSVSSDKSDSSLSSLGSISSSTAQSGPVDMTYFNDAVFVGDSLTVGLGAYGVLPSENIYADTGLNLDTIEKKQCISTANGTVTVAEAIKLSQPAKIYIMLGSNGIAWMSIDSMISKYTTFFTAVHTAAPKAKIYIESILPVTAAKEASDSRYSNEKINEYNARLSEFTKTQNVFFLDTHSALVTSDGTLNTQYAEADGMHLKKAGYEALLEYFKSHTN